MEGTPLAFPSHDSLFGAYEDDRKYAVPTIERRNEDPISSGIKPRNSRLKKTRSAAKPTTGRDGHIVHIPRRTRRQCPRIDTGLECSGY